MTSERGVALAFPCTSTIIFLCSLYLVSCSALGNSSALGDTMYCFLVVCTARRQCCLHGWTSFDDYMHHPPFEALAEGWTRVMLGLRLFSRFLNHHHIPAKKRRTGGTCVYRETRKRWEIPGSAGLDSFLITKYHNA